MDQFTKFNIFFMQIISGLFVVFISDWMTIKVPVMTVGIPIGLWVTFLSPVTFMFVWIIEKFVSQKQDVVVKVS